MRGRTLLVASSLVLLAACGSEPEAPDAPQAESAAEAQAPAEPGVATTLVTIPARFHGVWDYVEGTCDPASDLRVEVGELSLGFYESYGEVTSVEAQPDGTVKVGLDMAGEGETWESELLLSLQDGDDVLVITHAEDRAPQPFDFRQRCAA